MWSMERHTRPIREYVGAPAIQDDYVVAVSAPALLLRRESCYCSAVSTVIVVRPAEVILASPPRIKLRDTLRGNDIQGIYSVVGEHFRYGVGYVTVDRFDPGDLR